MERRMERMLGRIREGVDNAEEAIGDTMNLLDRDHDGLVSLDELELVLKEKSVFKTEAEIKLAVSKLSKLCKHKSLQYMHLDDLRDIAARMDDTSDEEPQPSDESEEVGVEDALGTEEEDPKTPFKRIVV